MMAKGVYLLVFTGVLGLAGCAENAPLVASNGAKEAASVTAEKARTAIITRMEAMEIGSGARVALFSQTPMVYELVKLSAPPRIILTFPTLLLSPEVQPQVVNLSTISAIYPSNEGDKGGSHIEIILKEDLSYDIQERPDGLDLLVLAKSNQKESGAVDSNQIRIQDLKVSQGASGTRLNLIGTGKMAVPKVFRLEQPPRLVVEMGGLSQAVPAKQYAINSPEVSTAVLGGSAEKVRLVIDLTDAKVGYQLDLSDGLPAIFLARNAQTLKPSKDALQRDLSLEDLAFTRDREDSVLHIQLNRPGAVLQTKQDGDTILLDLEGVHVPDKWVQRLDVKAFGGVVSFIDAYNEQNNAHLVVTLTDLNAKHEIIQKDTEILLRVIPPMAQTTSAPQEKNRYTGKKISMDFKDIDVQNAFKLLAQVSNQNILLSDTVKGTLTMRLVEVPWDQAMDLMLEAKGLGKLLEGNVLRIAPLSDIQQNADARLQAQESNQKLEPLVTKMIPVSFASATDIQKLLMEGSQGGSGGGGNNANKTSDVNSLRLLSSRGSVTVDARTNTLIVKDTAANLVKIREMVAELDKSIPQVLIEARIVIMDRNASQSFGINWGANFKGAANDIIGVSDNSEHAYQVQQDVTETYERRPSMSGGVARNVSLIPSGTSSQLGIHVGSISPLLDLDIELGAMENTGKSRTISSPRVLATNNRAASINQGLDFPYDKATTTNGVTVVTTEFMKADLGIKVTPHVTSNGYVTLDVQASNNTLVFYPGVTTPGRNTREVDTQVLVKDGESIVLGGIYQDTSSEDSGKIPKMHNIPFFGWLFKNISNKDNQSELLIFLTPRIINPE
ncbi:MAG: type IV pilus secretin PilQ [Magnetococcus sp. DMHC-6]